MHSPDNIIANVKAMDETFTGDEPVEVREFRKAIGLPEEPPAE